MIKYITSFLFCSIFYNLSAQSEINFSVKTHQFDTVPYYGNTSCNFMVTNTGTDPLIINSVKTSCGCDYAQVSKEPILPNDTVFIKYKYDSKRVGPINKSITVQSNDPVNPTVVLRVKGFVLPKKEY